MKIEFSETELQSLVGLLDAGVRASGLRGVKEAAGLLDKLEAAAAKSKPGGNGKLSDLELPNLEDSDNG